MTGIRLLLPMLLLVLAGCGSSGLPAYLYADAARTKLLDSEIRMETNRQRRGGPGPDLRVVACENGRLLARYSSPTRREEGEGEISPADYAAIWEEVMTRAGWSAEPEAADPQGGYYHFIRYRLGTRVGETSAQSRTNFLGLGTENIHSRLELANAITDLVSASVSVRRTAGAAPAETTP